MKGGIFILTLKADFNELKVTSERTGFFTSGSVNAYKVKFEFSEDWETLRVIPVFKAGKTLITPDVSLSAEWNEGGVCTVPREIFREENIGERIYAGLIGMNDEDYVVTTVYAFIGHVFEGASEGSGGDSGISAAIERILSEMESLNERLDEAESTLASMGISSVYDYAVESGYAKSEVQFKEDLSRLGEYLSKNANFTRGDLMVFDLNGNAADSGKTPYDFALANHIHSEYSPVNHEHIGYALTSHSHTEYAPTNHSHPEYAAADHSHSQYAQGVHTHSVSDISVSESTSYSTPQIRAISLTGAEPVSIPNGFIVGVYE